jgi:opacity protein-like surface antigen
MKAYKKLLLAAVMVTGAASAAQATDLGNNVPAETYQALGFYLRADAGWSFLDWSGGKNDNNVAVGGGVGYRFNDNLRTDLRVDYAGKYSVAPGSDMSITTALGNLYFDIPTGTAFTPYLGAGVGYGWAPVSNGPDKNGLAVGLMAGVGVDLTNNLTLDVGYRFRDIMSSGSDPMEHQVLAGIRYQF